MQGEGTKLGCFWKVVHVDHDLWRCVALPRVPRYLVDTAVTLLFRLLFRVKPCVFLCEPAAQRRTETLAPVLPGGDRV